MAAFETKYTIVEVNPKKPRATVAAKCAEKPITKRKKAANPAAIMARVNG